MSQPLHILFASAEVAPYSKVGGLADVAGALPQALARLGHSVRVATPLYRTVDTARYAITQRVCETTVSFGGRTLPVAFWRTASKANVEVYFVDCPTLFHRPSIYGESDDLERFLAFSLAAVELPKHLGWEPGVLHANDWHAAFAAAHLASLRRQDPFYRQWASVYTIHNLQYQGNFRPDWLGWAIGDRDTYEVPRIIHQLRGRWPSMAALALFHADGISTVSPTYAREVLSPEYGSGLEPLLRHRTGPVYGILNGIDYDVFNPATDPHLAARFTAASLEKRAANKQALQARAALPVDASVPVLGWVNRLVEQKGIDITVKALEAALASQKCQFVLLGTGEPAYEAEARQLAHRFPNQVAAFVKFDEALASLLYGGADVLLVPSRFEPCGLGQLIAFRYGAVPLVRRTGGLADTVADCSEDLASGSGFVFQDYSAQALGQALDRALAAYRNTEGWRGLVQRNMALDFSWDASARRYEELYRTALGQVANPQMPRPKGPRDSSW